MPRYLYVTLIVIGNLQVPQTPFHV